MLRRFDFPEFARDSREKSKGAGGRYLNEKLASLVPLSISNPLPSSPLLSKRLENRKAKRGITMNIASACSPPHAKYKVYKLANKKSGSAVKGISSNSSSKDRDCPGSRAIQDSVLSSRNEASQAGPELDSDSDAETGHTNTNRTRMDIPVDFFSEEFKFDPSAFQTPLVHTCILLMLTVCLMSCVDPTGHRI